MSYNEEPKYQGNMHETKKESFVEKLKSIEQMDSINYEDVINPRQLSKIRQLMSPTVPYIGIFQERGRPRSKVPSSSTDGLVDFESHENNLSGELKSLKFCDEPMWSWKHTIAVTDDDTVQVNQDDITMRGNMKSPKEPRPSNFTTSPKKKLGSMR